MQPHSLQPTDSTNTRTPSRHSAPPSRWIFAFVSIIVQFFTACPVYDIDKAEKSPDNDSYDYHDEVTYSCRSGYEPNNMTVTCLDSGLWSKDLNLQCIGRLIRIKLTYQIDLLGYIIMKGIKIFIITDLQPIARVTYECLCLFKVIGSVTKSDIEAKGAIVHQDMIEKVNK